MSDRELETEQKVKDFCADRLTSLDIGSVERLEGGLLNFVWRLEACDGTYVLKQSPPYIATDPETPLDADRLSFEVQALNYLAETDWSSNSVGAPSVLKWFPEDSVLVEDYIPGAVSLNEAFEDKSFDSTQRGRALGKAIGLLHRRTVNEVFLKRNLDNRAVQQTRNEVQYRGVVSWLEKQGSAQKAEKIRDLGEWLLNPGVCMTMGDLWPRSVLLNETGTWLIDWEFSHYGWPLQDTAHLAAHCWMHWHVGDDAAKSRIFDFWHAFLHTYEDVVRGTFDIDGERLRRCRHHFAAEVLVRTVGAFSERSVYEDVEDRERQKRLRGAAIDIAERYIESGRQFHGMFDVGEPVFDFAI